MLTLPSMKSSKSPEPELFERVYVRSITSGDRGYLIEDGSKVRVPRGSGRNVDMKYDERTWAADGDGQHPLLAYHIGRVCHAADAALGDCLHDYDRGRVKYEALSKKGKKAWEEVGPTKDPIRIGLWEAIHAWGETVKRVD